MEDILDRLARQFPEIDVKKIQHKLPDPNKQKSIYGTRSRDKQLPISQMLYLANVEQFDLLHLLIQCVPIPSIHGGNYLIVTPHKPTQPTKSYEFMRPYLGSGRSGRVSNHTFAPDGCLSLVLRDGYRISIKQYMEQYAKHHGPSDHDISFFPMEKNRDDSRNYIVSLCFSLFSCPICSSRFFLRCLLEEKLTESLRTVIVHEMCNLLDIQNKETWPRLSDYHAVAAGMTSMPPTHMKQFIVEYDDWKRWRKDKEFEPFVTVGSGTSPDSIPPSPYSPSTPYSNGSSRSSHPNESTTTKTPSNMAKRKLPNYLPNDPNDSDDSIQFIEEVSPPAAKRPSDSTTTSGYESDCMVLDMVKADKATVVTVDIDENQEFTETVGSKTKKDPKVSCKACSMKFFTTSGLQEHMRKSHSSDISVTEKVLEEDLGILRQSTSFLCRICCVAYQSKSRFDSHMNNHKSRKASFFACPHCSGTQVSKSDLEKHVKRHQAQQDSEFICTHCHPHITMYSEGAYYHHILTHHNAELYYFCKRCLMGSTDGLRIYAHIKDNCLTTIEIMNDLFGVANARDIKFHPDHIDNYKTLIKLDPTTVVPLSQCNNHTMVRFGLNFTTCPDDPTCFGLCNIQRFCNVRGVEEKDPWRTTSTKLPNSQATTILNHVRRLYAIESMKPPAPAAPATLPLRLPLNNQTSNRNEITPFSAVQCFICQHVFKMCTMATCSLEVAISTCELISNQYTIALKEPNSDLHKKMMDRIKKMHNEWSKVFSCMTHYNPAHIENGILSKSLLPPHIDYDLLKRNNNH